MSYFGDIKKGIQTTVKGLGLTWKHLFDARHTRGAMNVEDPAYFQFDAGHVTLQYPHVQLSVPDNGRYQLDCEIDDCIVCDKCAKVCPVDCIDIEAIKSPGLIRTTSDGSPVRLHAAKFDIDMAKCCFCGLCTTVCPTECLTMKSDYDFSVWDVNEMNFEFANLTPGQAEEKRQLYNEFVAEKEAAKAAAVSLKVAEGPTVVQPELALRSSVKPSAAKDPEAAKPSKPAFVPTRKPTPAGFKPTMKPPVKTPDEPESTVKPAFTPTVKPRPAGFKPTMKPTVKTPDEPESTVKPAFTPTAKPKPAGFKPTMKPTKKEGADE